MPAVMNQVSTTVQGVRITRDDVLRAMERFDAELRATYPSRKWKKYAVRHSEKDYPPKDLLRLATGLSKVPGGGDPVNRHFEAIGFSVDFLDEDTIVDPATKPSDEEDETSISLEVDIENALVLNLSQLEAGLHLYQEGDRTGQQFQISFDAKKQGRIDILAVDEVGNFIVIEIKAGEADRDVCGQIQGYMGWVKEHLAEIRTAELATSGQWLRHRMARFGRAYWRRRPPSGAS
jgi:hypothetical protein